MLSSNCCFVVYLNTFKQACVGLFQKNFHWWSQDDRSLRLSWLFPFNFAHQLNTCQHETNHHVSARLWLLSVRFIWAVMNLRAFFLLNVFAFFFNSIYFYSRKAFVLKNRTSNDYQHKTYSRSLCLSCLFIWKTLQRYSWSSDYLILDAEETSSHVIKVQK